MEFNFILMRLTLLTDYNTPIGVVVGGVVDRKKAGESQPYRGTPRLLLAVVDIILDSVIDNVVLFEIIDFAIML